MEIKQLKENALAIKMRKLFADIREFRVILKSKCTLEKKYLINKTLWMRISEIFVCIRLQTMK